MENFQIDQEVTNLISQWIQEALEEEKTFKCNDCLKQFTYKRGLVRHQKSAHHKIKYPCQNCTLEFGEKYDLKRHQVHCNGGSSKRRHSEPDRPSKKQEMSDKELIEHEVANISPQMLEEYDGEILGDEEVLQEGGRETKECALKEKATIFKYQPNKNERIVVLRLSCCIFVRHL